MADSAYEDFLGTPEAQASFTWTDIREAVEYGMVQGALYPAHSPDIRARASDAYMKLVLLYRFEAWTVASRTGESETVETAHRTAPVSTSRNGACTGGCSAFVIGAVGPTIQKPLHPQPQSGWHCLDVIGMRIVSLHGR